MQKIPTDLPGEGYANAAALFAQMDSLRKVWANFRPAPPLTHSDLMMLGTVDKLRHQSEEPVTISRLARHMHQSAPGISQKVSVLEEMGYVKRTAHKTDRRVAYIALTPKGAAVAQTTMREFFGRMEQALAILGPQKVQNLLALMRELTDAIQAVQAGQNEMQGGNDGC